MPAEVDPYLYVLSFNNGTIGGHLHWMVGAGSLNAVNAQLIDDRWNETKGLPTRIRLVMVGRTRIALYRYPNNAGGFQRGHVAAFAHVDGRVLFASVHGHSQVVAAIAILADLLRST